MNKCMELAYEYKTDPFKHQRGTLGAVWVRGSSAIFWEQGLRESKFILGNADIIFDTGEIALTYPRGTL